MTQKHTNPMKIHVKLEDLRLNHIVCRILKRIEDIIVSTIILTLTSPILLIISIVIKTTSKGPIIFRQKRNGINNKEIIIYKFRSMTTQDSDLIIKQASKNDSRVTPIGRFLRASSLDELPQFLNVIQGTMSVVGPRPHALIHNKEYSKLIPEYNQRVLVKPGITGLSQINGWRGETDTLEKMQNRIDTDLIYLTNWSLWLDVKIIFITIIKGFFDKNAY